MTVTWDKRKRQTEVCRFLLLIGANVAEYACFLPHDLIKYLIDNTIGVLCQCI